MSLENSNSLKKCPVCGVGQLRIKIISEQYEHEDRGRIVLVQTANVPIEDCDFCGKSFCGPESARIRHEALGRALGLLSPDEIIAVRRNSGMNQADFARLIGVEGEDVSAWERGRAWQDRAVDNLLRVLSENPHVLDHLRNDKISNAEVLVESPVTVID